MISEYRSKSKSWTLPGVTQKIKTKYTSTIKLQLWEEEKEEEVEEEKEEMEIIEEEMISGHTFGFTYDHSLTCLVLEIQ